MKVKADLLLGEVLKTFGNQGELIIRMDDANSNKLNIKEPVFIIVDGLSVPFYFSKFDSRAGKIIAMFDNMESENLAKELVGKKVYLKPPISAKIDIEVSDFINFRIEDKNLGNFGIVNDFFDYPGNPCLEVLTDEGNKFMIPLNAEYVLKISKRENIIKTDLPDGLLII